MRKTTWIAILLVLAAVAAGVTLFSQNRGGAASPIAMSGGHHSGFCWVSPIRTPPSGTAA